MRGNGILSWLSPAADEMGECGHAWMPDDAEPVSEIIPERDTKLGASVHEPEERVAAITAGIAAGPAADLALDNVAADGEIYVLAQGGHQINARCGYTDFRSTDGQAKVSIRGLTHSSNCTQRFGQS